MGWLIALAVIILIGCLPFGIRGRYDASGASASLLVGPFPIEIYPRKREKRTRAEKAKPDPKRKAEKSGRSTASKQGGSYQDFLPVVRIILEFLNDFRGKLRVKNLELKLILASDDPSDLAVNYGKAWAALGNLLPQLERVFVIHNRQIAVECDFTADTTVISARLDLTITIARLLHITGWHGARVIYHYFKIVNQRKGGANT